MVFYYLVIINLNVFVLMGFDKYQAIKDKPRISEQRLINSCLLGGFIGLGLGMVVFNHKIRKRKFIYILVISTIIYTILLSYYYLS